MLRGYIALKLFANARRRASPESYEDLPPSQEMMYMGQHDWHPFRVSLNGTDAASLLGCKGQLKFENLYDSRIPDSSA